MKKLILALALFASVPAFAQHHGHYGHGYYRSGPGWGWWVAPVVTGVIGYEIARNQPPVIVQQPVIIQPTPVPPATVYYGQTQTCTEWVEVQQADGTITRTRTCRQ